MGNALQLYTQEDLELAHIALVLFRILTEFFVVLPILFFKNVGVFHLLVLPFLLNLVKNIVQKPLALLQVFFSDGVQLDTTSSSVLSYEQLLQVNLEESIYGFVFLLLVYVGYFGLGNVFIGGFKPKYKEPTKSRFVLLTTFLLGVILIFFVAQGGVTAWIRQWGAAGSRADAMEGLGPALRLMRVTYFVPLVWYATKGSKVFKNPIFVLVLLISISVGFFATGSRSSILYSVIPFLIIYTYRNNELPITRTLFLGSVFFVLFGLLGQIRTASTFNQGDFSWDSIDYSVEGNIEHASEESNQWGGLGAGIAVYNSVPEEVDFLYGKTYVTFLAFAIPRAIWPNKPHSAGHYVAREIFNNKGGIPPGEVAEAYWNFGVFGVLIMGFLKGVLIRLFQNTFLRRRDSIAALGLYVIILVTGVTVNSLGLTTLLQSLLLVFLGLKFLRLV
ncbi:MAG: oligosaccharide repeat unit polymerase [Leptolyngbya sp. SIO3F4]|nr:oligosaccharide repeat unit polymerase [Leptolyngbya sp. SIO3F4]